MPIGAARGPNGTMWFTEGCAGLAVLAHGKVKQYLITGITGQSPAILRGPDGAMWFSEDGTARIGRIGPEGKLRTYAGPLYESKFSDVANAVTVGPDGNLWWTAMQSNVIWAMNLRGRVVHAYTIPTPNSAPWGIATGRDGALWFTESAGNKIGRVTTRGVFSEYPLPTPWARPQGIARNRDGSLWFVESGADQLGRIAD
jgi:virginiamycin B lyase